MTRTTLDIRREDTPWGRRLCLKEAAAYLRIGVSTLQKRMATGKGPRGERFNSRYEFEIADLDRWRQSQARKI